MSLKVYFKDPSAPKPTQPFLPGTCAVILNSAEKILLHKREDSNLWTLPGGKMEIGESISNCCKREIKEEIGLRVKIKKIVGIYTSPDYTFDFGGGFIYQPFVVAFLCTTDNENFSINHESTDIKWFDKKEVFKLKTISNTPQIIKQAFRNKDAYFD